MIDEPFKVKPDSAFTLNDPPFILSEKNAFKKTQKAPRPEKPGRGAYKALV